MTSDHILTPDSQAVILLCSTLGSESESLRPLRPREWNDLAQKLEMSNLSGPADLLGLTAQELSGGLGLSEVDANRVFGLLERGGQLAIELERLISRGIWPLTRLDRKYPTRLNASLKHAAPPVLFGAGDTSILNQGGVAVVGSRNIDEAGVEFAQRIAELCAGDDVVVISGGARGTDAIAMGAALEAGGKVVGVLADSLERSVRAPDVREPLSEGRLTMVTPYWPSVSFSIPGAMGRNKIIYGLADYAVVVASDFEKGGTWAGAVEALKGGFCGVFVRADEEAPEGNSELRKKGAMPLRSTDITGGIHSLADRLTKAAPEVGQTRSLFEDYDNSCQQTLLIPVDDAESAELNVDASSSEGVDLFEVIWPHLSLFLQKPRTVDEIKDAFRLEKAQVIMWLKRAETAKRVVRKTRPIRYQCPQ
jgi:predicted Rossmann fold nucleotide-binding protein DprA/Smf involved in DNA uptake